MREPLRLAFLGCGFITRVHSRHVKESGTRIVCSYASRDRTRADEYCRRYRGAASYDSYAAAIEDPRIDAVVVAVPPRFHVDLTLRALAAGKHVLVEKPAFPRLDDFTTVIAARDTAGRVVLVEGPGITGADLSRLTFRKVRRPIWPLDPAEAIAFSSASG